MFWEICTLLLIDTKIIYLPLRWWILSRNKKTRWCCLNDFYGEGAFEVFLGSQIWYSFCKILIMIWSCRSYKQKTSQLLTDIREKYRVQYSPLHIILLVRFCSFTFIDYKYWISMGQISKVLFNNIKNTIKTEYLNFSKKI